jgi:hypothetical protein
MRTARGVAQLEFGRRQRARRSARNRQPVDAETIEKIDPRIGPVRGRSVLGKGAPEIAEARGRDDAMAAPTQPGREEQPLIEAAARAVDHHDRWPAACDGVFQRARPAVDDDRLSEETACGLRARLAEPARGEGAGGNGQATRRRKDATAGRRYPGAPPCAI